MNPYDISLMAQEAGLGDLLADEVIHDDELSRFAGLCVGTGRASRHAATMPLRLSISADRASMWASTAVIAAGLQAAM